MSNRIDYNEKIKNRFFSLRLLFLSILYFKMVASPTQITLKDSIDLKATLTGNTFGNMLKILSVAVDEKNDLAYISSILTPYVSIIDLNSGKETGSLKMSFASVFVPHQLYINPSNQFLLSYTNKDTEAHQLYYIDPKNQQLIGTYTLTYSLKGFDIDTNQNKIFIADGSTIKMFDGTNFNQVGKLNSSYTIGDIVIDNGNSMLYIASQELINDSITIEVYSTIKPYSYQDKIRIASSEGVTRILLDQPHEKYILAGHTTIRTFNSKTNFQLNQVNLYNGFNDIAYYRNREIAYITNEDGYSEDGKKGIWSKTYIFKTFTGELDSLFDNADKACKLAVDNKHGYLLRPYQHSAIVDITDISTDWNPLYQVDIGESVDDIAISPTGDHIYLVERLGGNKIFDYAINNQKLEEFEAGHWPSAAEVDTSLNRLYIVNHFESNIMVYKTSTHQLLDTIPLTGLPEGRTDAICTMALDQITHKLYIAFPEFNSIAVVSLLKKKVEFIFQVSNFSFNSEKHKAIGCIQLCPISQLNKLYVFLKEEKVLQEYDLLTYQQTGTFTFFNKWNFTVPDEHILTYDPHSNILFVANHLFNPGLSLSPSSYLDTLSIASSWLGYASDKSTFYTLGIMDDSVAVFQFTLNRAIVDTFKLYTFSEFIPNYEFNSATEDLYISEFNQAILRHYQFENSIVTSLGTDTKFESIAFPNPFDLSSQIIVHPTINTNKETTIVFYNTLGERKEFYWIGNNITFNIEGCYLKNGMYTYQIIQGHEIISTGKIIKF